MTDPAPAHPVGEGLLRTGASTLSPKGAPHPAGGSLLAPGAPPDTGTARLLASRVELLDLTLRNPLLNYRGSNRRGLEIIDERSTQVFTELVVARAPLRFHHTRAVPAKDEHSDTSVFFLDEAATTQQVGLGDANPENSLATPYTKEGLAERLLATSSDARLTLEEQGANTLFVTLGMLRWRDPNEPSEDRLAPLILIPVRLERKSARSFWQVIATDEESGANLSLVEKLKELGIKLSSDPDLETVEQLESFLASVEQAIGEKTGWAVDRNRIVLGFFSFGKFLMYRDLDPALWPPERPPGRHPMLTGLLVEGFREPSRAVAPDVSMDELRPPGKTMEVMDADGSQAEALAEVAAGRALVIQGPPGTGKSQTISNLIAEAVFAGRTVLFVAEKRAALEVVKRRLENIGLGELCLELHSNKTSKKEIASELAQTLALGKPMAPEGAELVHDLPEHREKLNRYAKAVASPVAGTGMTPYQAIGSLERLKSSPGPLPKIACPAMKDWTPAGFGQALSRVQDVATKIADLGVPAKHPFDGVGRTELLPGDEEKIGAALLEAAVAAAQASGVAGELGRYFKSAPPGDAAALEAWIRFAAFLLEAPDLRGIPPPGPSWENLEMQQGLGLSLKAGLDYQELRRAQDPRLAPHAWDTDVSAARGDLVSGGISFFSRLFSSRYRAARRLVQGLCNPPPPTKPFDLVLVTDALLKARQLRAEIDRRGEVARGLLGTKWQGLDSAWEELGRLRDWVLRFRSLLAATTLPPSVAEWVVGAWNRDELRALFSNAKEALARWRQAWSRVASLLAWVGEGRGELQDWPFARGGDEANRWRSELGRLPGYVGYWRLRQELVGLGLLDLAKVAHEGTLIAPSLPDALEKAWAERVLDQAYRERPELREFDAVTHEQVVHRFRRADSSTFAINRARLADSHWRALPGSLGYGQVGLLRHEGAKKSRHLSIRRLMEQAGSAIQAAKPVFLMSPLSVAAYLPPGGPSFDLVVFDEASQVKPVDAFGAILRAKQLVVVGDEKQLPPTSFFDTLLSEGRVRDEDPPLTPASVTQDLQSVLGLCTSRGMPSRMLRWHYRSRHDSLIALSNREFYEDHLVVFPSPRRDLDGEGLSYRHLPLTVYERGTSRSNPKEADAVVDAVVEHARARPELSLGVVAFSQSQRNAIELRLEQRRRKDAEFDAFVGAVREEPFFVKNLENVQGDERDVMFISVGYGRDVNGAVSMNFGPLNQGGGERRLNVLITRARRQCVVFTNLAPDDLDLRRAPGEGVRVFKSFLAFAKEGTLPVAPAGQAEEEFGRQVQAALRARGFEVEAAVGSGGYRMDLAVVDPAVRGRYLLGIECDGGRYTGARWARDRDRLRESVLRGLGWRLHRIWSADWFRNRDEAIRRLVAAIEEAKKTRGQAAEAPREPAVRRAKDSPPPGFDPVPAYLLSKARAKIGEAHLSEIDTSSLAGFISEIVGHESPIHREELQRRTLAAIDQRPGTKKIAAIDEALVLAVSRGLVRRVGEFLWSKEERPVVPRDRSLAPDPTRELDAVCDEECRAALVRVVRESRGCTAEEAAVQAVKLLGVKRNDAGLSRLGGLLGGLAADGSLIRNMAGGFVPPR